MKKYRKFKNYYVVYHLDRTVHIDFYDAETFNEEFDPSIIPLTRDGWINFINNDVFADKNGSYSCTAEELNILKNIEILGYN